MNYNYGTISTATNIITNTSEKMKWHMKSDPYEYIAARIAKTIRDDIDRRILESLTVGDGSK